MDARVLGREVARAGCTSCDELAAVRRASTVTTRAGRERAQLHLEPVAGAAGGAQEHQLAADRVDREVDAAVVVEVGGGDAAAVDAREPVERRRGALASTNRCRDASRAPGSARVLRQVRDRDVAVREHEVEPAVVVRGRPRSRPSRSRSSPNAAANVARASTSRSPRPRARRNDGVPLAARVRARRSPAARRRSSRCGDAHAGVRVGDAARASRCSTKWKPSGPPGTFTYSAVRVLVVRDVEVEPAVAVHVGEDRAERVVVRLRVEPDLPRRPPGSARVRRG